VTTNPGSSFRAIHESLINYGGNKPELLTCLHEEIAVGMCHGYAKVAGKPLLSLLHGPPGLTHAAMAVYNAWCDRVPLLMISGNTADAASRRSNVEWNHSAQDVGAMLRDVTKWADQPTSVKGFGEAMTRAYALTMTPPFGPVLVTADLHLQEDEEPEDLPVPRARPLPTAPAPDPGAIGEAARLLAGAESPLIVVDFLVRTQQGMNRLVELAELLQAPVIDRLGRFNMPTRHPLNQSFAGSGLVRQADVILALEVWDAWGAIHQVRDVIEPRPVQLARETAKLITISTNELLVRSNLQSFQRYPGAELSITADGEGSMPQLIEAVRRALPGTAKSAVERRGAALAEAHRQQRERARLDASYGWDASPISVARLCAELWDQLKGLDWAMVSDTLFKSQWPQKLWSFDKSYQYIGGSGGQGQGYGPPAAVGAALAHRPHGRVVLNIQGDGDFLYCPQTLWTAVHHNIPLLTVMHNNRAYHQEVMHIQRLANWHARGVDRAHIGTVIDNPAVDFAKMAASMGMWSEGPIASPGDLAPAIRRALDVVRRGEPALLDIVCQPR
jgi:acetolactate synthase-1/2/3 large subunit